MNGVHDMGGMHGFCPVQPEENEPVFHSPWEARMFGMAIALGPHGIHDPEGLRSSLENMAPGRNTWATATIEGGSKLPSGR